jgi:hypothetical protein
MYEESQECVDQLWGLNGNEWKEVDVMPTVQHMIAQVALHSHKPFRWRL